jgi:hypothetical protein
MALPSGGSIPSSTPPAVAVAQSRRLRLVKTSAEATAPPACGLKNTVIGTLSLAVSLMNRWEVV